MSGSTRAWRLMDFLRSYVLMSRGADDKDNLYLGEFSSISFDLYLKNIVFRCRVNVPIDERYLCVE